MFIDPICGMQVEEKSSLKVTKDGGNYFFCSTHCRDKFFKQEGIQGAQVCQPQKRVSLFKNKLFLVTSLALILILVSNLVPVLASFRETFLMYVKTVWWAVLLGLGLGGIIDYYVPREYISKILAKNRPSAIFNSVFLGFLMSACSHGILALSIQLHKKGASNPAVVSFLLASPWANFAVTMMMLSLFGLKALFIIFGAILIAINTGFVFMLLDKKGLIEKNKNVAEVPEQFSIFRDFKLRIKNYRPNLKNDLKGVLGGSVSLSNMVLWWIVLGILIASLAGTFIPAHIFHKYMGPTLVGLLVTLALATVIEVCSEGSSPLAFEIFRQTGALGNSFVFLMAGVATDYTEIGLLWANVGRRVALWMPVITVPQVVLLGYIFNIIFR